MRSASSWASARKRRTQTRSATGKADRKACRGKRRDALALPARSGRRSFLGRILPCGQVQQRRLLRRNDFRAVDSHASVEVYGYIQVLVC